MKFTAAQSNALEYDKNMLVEAGAGSGKTAVFVERYVKICLENMTIEPENILALTFTNKAADECKERIRKRLEEEGSTQKNWSELLQKASITTFHGFCAQLCRQYSLILQLSPDFSILDENEANYLFQLAFEETIRDCSKAHDTHLKTYLKIFNLQRLEQDLLTCLKKKKWFLAAMNKNGSVNADEGVLLNALQHIFKKVGAKYQQLKVTLNCCDYDDLFVYVDELLRHPKVSQQLQRKYQYIMVDECQDTDPYQWELIQRLAADYHPLNEKKYFLVGDGKQSIYSFRGADLNLFNQLMQTFEQNIDTSTIVRLADNFRSQSIILDTLNPLFETLFEKVGSQPMKYQPLNAFRTDVSGAVECHLIKDDATFQGEVNAISGWINNVCKLSQYSLNDIVILVRKRSQCQKWKEALQKHGIEVHLDQESGFFQKQPVIDLFQLCTISVVPNDALAWLTLLKSPFFSWNQDLIHGLFVCTNAGRIEDKWQEIEQWEDKLFKQFELNIDDQRLIKKACKWVKLFQKWRHTKSLSQLCIDFLTESGARKIYDEQNPFNHELIDQFLTIIENLEAQPYLSRYELIKRLEFRLKNTSTQIKALAGNREALRIMTIHASKGLEFPVVILPECNQPFPIKKSDPLMITANQVSLSLGSNITQPLRKEMLDQVTAHAIEEEKRLFYVAATRAKDRLLFSAVINEKTGKKPSPLSFLFQHYTQDDDQLKLVPKEGLSGLSIPLQVQVPAYDDNRPVSRGKNELAEPEIEQTKKEMIDEQRQVPMKRMKFIATSDMLRKDGVRHRKSTISTPSRQQQAQIQVGILVHTLIREWYEINQHEQKKLMFSCFYDMHVPPYMKSDSLRNQLIIHFDKIKNSTWLKNFQDRSKAFEKSFQFKKGNQVINGRIDMVVFDEEKIWIVDFKTESFMHQKVSDIQQKYGGQLALYKEAIQAIYKNNHIETWLYSTLDDHAIRGE